ncbi:hypothetical protein [Fructobacillus parabroussonetiae]|uniref:Uncharacterized protein n=1 Tax=Fructobacillus parabroussonetiae TaxID=2713174 RepID=A0ABS5R151_9LACO|nr:hypothetical protein [Fructobacillus parabroussonetiae]MBS9337887.1 hypothetical protein [Fructobacillus parabroussonetiae]
MSAGMVDLLHPHGVAADQQVFTKSEPKGGGQFSPTSSETKDLSKEQGESSAVVSNEPNSQDSHLEESSKESASTNQSLVRMED